VRKSDELKLKAAVLKLQYNNLIRRYERQRKRDAFIKKHLKEILPLSMDGWPRMKQMKDYRKWIDIVYKAKINGIYGIGTANCDVIAQLNRFAKEIKQN
jgi:hypothetical protein